MHCPNCNHRLPVMKSLMISPLLHGRCSECGAGLTKSIGAVLITAVPSGFVLALLHLLMAPSLGEKVAMLVAAAVGLALLAVLERYFVDLRLVRPRT